MITDKKIRAYALKNALAHDGKSQAGSVISALFVEGLKKEDVKKYIKQVNEIVQSVNKLPLEEQEAELEELKEIIHERKVREGLEELPNVRKSGVIMRFRPSPSGPLHVGHIVSNILSSMYVKKYGGKFYIIIDDTDPESAILDSYKKIKEDCDWIFGNVKEYISSSDRVEIYYKYAEELIKKRAAYVCTCSVVRFKEFSNEMKDCPCRSLNARENLERWEKMLDKTSNGFREGEAVLRFKTSNELGGMKNSNPAMRDFPLARINLAKHPKQGNKYKVWPLMNLAVAVDDIEYKMTHIIRGKDHRDNAERQKMIFKIFNKEYPWSFFMGRIKFSDLILSKRKIISAIERGEYKDWEDEKLPTIASLRKREYKPEAFAKFAEQRGLTEVDKVISMKDFFQILDTFNKQA